MGRRAKGGCPGFITQKHQQPKPELKGRAWRGAVRTAPSSHLKEKFSAHLIVMFLLMLFSQQAADSTELSSSSDSLSGGFPQPGMGRAAAFDAEHSGGKQQFHFQEKNQSRGVPSAPCRTKEEQPGVRAGGLALCLGWRAVKQPLKVFPGQNDMRARREGGGELLCAQRGSQGSGAGISAL